MSETRVLKYHITKTHPDYEIVRVHCSEARRLFNGLNAVAREYENLRYNGVLETPIATEMGVQEWVLQDRYLGSLGAFEPIRKKVEAHQSIRLPQKVAQSVVRNLARSWKSCIALRSRGSSAGSVGYKKRYGLVEYNPQAISGRALRKGRIIPTGWSTGFKLPEGTRVKSARAHHSHGNVFILEVIHEIETTHHVTGEVTAAIDLGVNKLAAITFSDGRKPFLVDGLPLKSVNQGAHRLNAEKEVKSKQGMWKKRNRRINHYLHSASSAIIKTLLERGVNKLVIGYNEGFKDSPNMGRRNNQRFASIPFARFRDMLTYKAEAVGINVLIQEESYTSKSSFMDNDPLPVYAQGVRHSFSGRRVRRGMYKAGDGSLIHADVNGSYNILRKSKPSFGWCRGIVVMPVNLKFAY